MTKFPSWINIKDIKKIFKALDISGESRLVGGCVRDLIINRKNSDIDIATTVEPKDVIKLLGNSKIKTIETGIKHGTITAIINHTPYEITTLRKDVETFGRHASIEFTDNWEEDAKRRDFTINAMSMDLDGKLYDYSSGQKDLSKKIIKFVGDPEERIKEDYLRILRYFRFISYLGKSNIDKKSLDACSKLADGLTSLSGERLRTEILKISSSEYIKDAFQMMDEYNILKHIHIKKLSNNYLDYNFSSDPFVNFAAILRCSEDIRSSYSPTQARFRLSNAEAQLLHKLVIETGVEIIGDEKYQKREIYKHGADLYKKLLSLEHIENPNIEAYQAFITLADTWEAPHFIINGEDLIKIGYNGSQIGKKLHLLHELWIESNFELTKEQLLQRL